MVSLAQIGVGMWGKNLLRNFYAHPKVRVVVVSDLKPSVLESIRKSYPDVQVTTDAGEAIGHPEVQAVVIATEPDTHYDYARQALLAGKHVFVEKPMVLDVKHGEELVELSERGGRVFMVGHLLEYHPAYLKVKEFVDQGELGEIYYLYSTRVNLGVVREKENALWSLAPHDISVALMLLKQRPLRVTAIGQSYLRQGVEDVVFVTLHFADEKMAHIHVSWLDPHKIRKLTVVGSKKMAVLEDTEPSEKIRLYDKGVDFQVDFASYSEALTLRIGDIYIPRVQMEEPLKLECDHFIQCVQGEIRPRSDARSGLQVVKILNAAQKSLKSHGEPVEIL